MPDQRTEIEVLLDANRNEAAIDRLCGHRAREVRHPGGMMNQGIPEFRLPRDVINREIEQVQALAVVITCGVEVGKDLSLSELRNVNDAVPLQSMPLCDVKQRDLTAEVETGYDVALAVDETQRCYRCHYKYEIDSDKCIYCDWCIKVKPRPECILKIKELTYDDAGASWDGKRQRTRTTPT